MKQRLKRWLFTLLGKDPEAVVVSFATGDPEMVRHMVEEARSLVPGRRHFVVSVGEPLAGAGVTGVVLDPGDAGFLWLQLRRMFRGLRIGLAPVLFDGTANPLRAAACALAPGRILAYNRRLERHHLQIRTGIASLLFLCGVPLDRIFLRPKWLFPQRRERSVYPREFRVLDGRPEGPRRRVAILSPYFPYPLSHGGAVRIFHLVREAAREFDIYLFAFDEKTADEDLAPVLELCAKVVLVPLPRYREPRWSTIRPSEAAEYDVPALHEALARFRREWRIELLQVEYTHLAGYGGDVLVEHDVTFDLKEQVWRANRTASAWWDRWRWRRFETRAIERFRRVVVMSQKDRELLGAGHARVIPNGVDLARFTPAPEHGGQRLLFIGSFRHFPNIAAFRFLTEEVWPLLESTFPSMSLTVVAGPDPWLYWGSHTGRLRPPERERVRVLEFVRDVKPLYDEANIVVVPTPVSAGTNLKVLEAMAMERAVVSTPAGCAGLGLLHLESVWVADQAPAFAAGVAMLASDPELRGRIAAAARRHAEQQFDWSAIGRTQSQMWRELLPESPFQVRRAREDDLAAIGRIQGQSPAAAQWEPRAYLNYAVRVAEAAGTVAGFLVFRETGGDEREILNVAVDCTFRRQGVATALIRHALGGWQGTLFLEVRESNSAARNLYRKLGFQDAGTRPGYYDNPRETAIVMKIHSC